MTFEEFKQRNEQHDKNVHEAYGLLQKDPEAYSEDGTRLRELIEEIHSYQEWRKDLNLQLILWKRRAE